MSGVEGVGAGAGAGAKTEQEILTEGGEGMSVANMMAEDAQGHARGKDDITRGPDREVVKGGEMATMSLRRENTAEIEAARPVGVKSIDGAMINTIDKSGEDEACAELAREWVARCHLIEAYHDHKRPRRCFRSTWPCRHFLLH
jgi:hypothetical protein